MRRGSAVVALALLGAAAAPGPAPAFYGNGAQIVSADPARQEQGNDGSTFAAISRDGRYVAFQTRASNFYADDDPDPPGQTREGGVFRKDLATGAVVRVASGDFKADSDGHLVARGARNPSISADGRYVAFSTDEKLVPADTNDNIDVYVRDMAKTPGHVGAFTLVSARDGSDAPARYAAPQTALPGRNLGADVTAGAAISNDGRRVAFLTFAPTDLPSRAATDTPAFQLWVRDSDARTTRLITARADNGDPAGGALGPAGISGDGSTAVWTGQNASTQTFFLSGEFPNDQAFFYLWKRIADGPSAPTRRITGAVDVDDPQCDRTSVVSPSSTARGPCYGPLTTAEGATGGSSIGNSLPAMSDDGRRLAFLTGAGPRPIDTTGPGPDLYFTDMSLGVSRKQGTLELTREGSGDPAASYPIEGVAMSADGLRVAITTVRTRYVLPTLRLVGNARAVPQDRDVYVIDLADKTIERATVARDGTDIDGDVAPDPTMDATGDRVAFASLASNFFFGDANNVADAFVITRTTPSVPPPPPAPPTIPPSRPAPRRPSLTVRARGLGRAVVELRVGVPLPGFLQASARARPPRPSGSRRTRRSPPLQTVAIGRARVNRPGTVRLRLALGAGARRTFRSLASVRARTTVSLRTSGSAKPISRTLTVTFVLRRKAPAGHGVRVVKNW